MFIYLEMENVMEKKPTEVVKPSTAKTVQRRKNKQCIRELKTATLMFMSSTNGRKPQLPT